MKKYKYLLILCLAFINCENKEEKLYDEDGNLLSIIQYDKNGIKDGVAKEFYKTGELKNITRYKNGVIKDTSKKFYKNQKIEALSYSIGRNNFYETYYDNGHLQSKGKIIDTIQSGWWKYYNKNGSIKSKIEYLNLEDYPSIKLKEFPNQVINYNTDGSINKGQSNYFNFIFKDTIKVNSLEKGFIELIPNLSKETNFHKVYFWKEDISGNVLDIDSTYGTNTEKALLWFKVNDTGSYKLKGFIDEKGYKNKKNKNDSMKVDIIEESKKLFFEKIIYVEPHDDINEFNG